MTALREIALLRLAAQRLAGPGCDTAAAAVRWMTAMQAQDYRGALTSVALRTTGRAVTEVEAALTAGEVVRSWPMRGTLHLVAAEDLAWMLRLTAPRMVAGAAARRDQLGIDAGTLARAEELAVQALRGGARLRRRELLDVWEAAGVSTVSQRGYHLLWHLAQHAVLCFGPVDAGQQLLVGVDEWIPHPRRPQRDEALGEWAYRYFCSHGPATVKDFTRWTNLLAADVRTALALARPRLATLLAHDVEYLMDPHTPDLLDACRRRAKAVFLLPGFDELLLGYTDRTAVLPAEFAGAIVPGGNGMFRPTVLHNGRVAGTWKYLGRGAQRSVDAIPFTAFPVSVTRALPRVCAALP